MRLVSATAGVVVVTVTAAGFARPAAAGPADPDGIVLLNKREFSLDVTGRVRDGEVDSAGIDIAVPPQLGEISERTVPRIAQRPLETVGTLDPQLLKRDLDRNFRELEVCRYKVAAADIAVVDLSAGEIALHWTVLPSGHTRDTRSSSKPRPPTWRC